MTTKKRPPPPQKTILIGFYSKIVIFALPFILVMSGIGGFGLLSGDLLSSAWVYRYQLSHPEVIYYPADGRTGLMDYKFTAIATYQPDVISLGSSRGYFIRQEFFREGVKYYNGGISSLSFTESVRFIEQMIDQDVLPSLILYTMDIPDFVADGDYRVDLEHEPHVLTFSDSVEDVQRHFADISVDLLEGISEQATASATALPITLWGRVAWDRERGFRYDGSMYLDIEPEYRDEEIEEDQLEVSYPVGDTASSQKIDQLATMLQRVQAQGVVVVGILPPLHPTTYAYLQTSDTRTYLMDIQTQITAAFNEQGVPLFDFTNPASVGTDDTEFYDHWHGHELVALRMLKVMAETNPTILAPYLDLQDLHLWIDQADDPFDVFDEIPN